MPLTAGDQLGPYEILAPIGGGGMGEVFRANAEKIIDGLRKAGLQIASPAAS